MDPRERRGRIVDDAKTFVISEDDARPDGARIARIRAAAEALLQAAQSPGMTHLGAGRPARPLNDGDLQAIYALGLDPTTLLEAATGALAHAA